LYGLKCCGIQGLKDFLVTSNGEKIANPKILSKYENKIAPQALRI